jgi:hypothetical protein
MAAAADVPNLILLIEVMSFRHDQLDQLPGGLHVSAAANAMPVAGLVERCTASA